MFQIKVPSFEERKTFFLKQALIYSLIITILLPIHIQSRSMFFKTVRRSDPESEITESPSNVNMSEDCEIYKDKTFHVIVDSVCDACHEMFSQNFPNLRAECRSDCFRNEKFSTCLKIFKPRDVPSKRSLSITY
uniref:Uncharacterized protein n=1 Tax=Parastrongyloides trichosuri TaxID=131310 RepID=A0A0N4ZCI8_PARTI